jgi:hypothetical protein
MTTRPTVPGLTPLLAQHQALEAAVGTLSVGLYVLGTKPGERLG